MSPLTKQAAGSFFDEKNREKLMGAYYSLPSFERRAFRALSVYYAPILSTNFSALLNLVKYGRKKEVVTWNPPKPLTPMLTSWERAGLLRKLTISARNYWLPNRLVAEPAAREALSLGEFTAITRVIEGNKCGRSGIESTWGGILFENRAFLIRRIRKAIYLDDESLFLDLKKNATYRNFLEEELLFGIPRCHTFIEILFNPFDEKMFVNLPGWVISTVLPTAYSFFMESPSEMNAIRQVLSKCADANPGDVQLSRIAALDMIGSGKIDEAQNFLASRETDDVQKPALLATIALIGGNLDGALAEYEAGLKKLRKETRRRKTGYSVWCGIFYPILLMRAGTPRKKILDYIDAVHDLDETMMGTYAMLRFLLEEGDTRQEIFAEEIALRVESGSIFSAFFFFLFANWIDPSRTAKLIRIAEKTCSRIAEAGMTYLSSELKSIMEDMSPGTADPLTLPAFPLKNIIRHKPGWEISLEALSEIVSDGHKAPGMTGTKRMIWRIAWRTDTNRRLSEFAARPYEQVKQAGGWSSGKEIALKRFFEKPDSIAGISDQDSALFPALSLSRTYYGTSVNINNAKFIPLLCGHQLLFKGDSDQRVEITEDEPKLTALSSGENYVLSLTPFPDASEQENGLAAYEESENSLKVIKFGEKHMKMARIIGPHGLTVPERAKESVLKALGGLAEAITIHSDISGIDSGAIAVPPDSRLYVQLQPNGDGLDAEAVIRPLGAGSAPCRPGIGGANIFGLKDGTRVHTRRDMNAETSSLEFFIGACRALSDADQTSVNRWHIESAELSLEFLLQLRDISGEVTAEWPKGGEMSVRRLGLSAMKVSVHAMRGWFSVTGELKPDEGLVWGMREILKNFGEAKGRFIKIGKDRFAAITDEFRQRVEELSSLGDQRGDEVRISPLSAAILSPLAEEAGEFSGDGEWKAKVRLIDEALSIEPDVPRAFGGELRGYQLDGYRWLCRLAHWGAGACLADDMGLGKTIQALALLLARGPGGPALVVAPTSVCSNWTEEASRFAPSLRLHELRAGANGDREALVNSLDAMDVLIATYGLLERNATLLCGTRWHTIILDEAQAIKNMDTKRSAAAMQLEGDFRAMTTGTPIENNLSELWNLFRFINPHYLGSLESFTSRFAIPIERFGDKKARKHLKRIISPFVLRRTKGQVLTELPPKTEITLRVEMGEEERAVYEAIRRNAVDELESNAGQDQRFMIFAQLVKLRRACCNSSLVMPQPSAPRRSAKLEAFSEVLEELLAGGHKALVFSQFVDHLSIIRNRLDEMGVTHQYLDGSTPPAERARRVKAFQSGEGDCFLISLRAGGTGLNLTAADYVVHMDPWWNPAVEEQASDRTHRIGQERPVTIYKIVAKDTIEEKIADLHRWKRDLAESLLDETAMPAKLSSEEMLELIRGE
jgi:superfamily II DNA or RNA helicase